MLRFFPATAILLALVAAACFKGEVASGTVQIVCGGEDKPCNFRIVAPLALERAELTVDGVERFPLMPDEIEHPLLSLFVSVLGGSAKSSAAIGILYLPPGAHIVRIVKPGFDAITRRITTVSGATQRLVIGAAELKRQPFVPPR